MKVRLTGYSGMGHIIDVDCSGEVENIPGVILSGDRVFVLKGRFHPPVDHGCCAIYRETFAVPIPPIPDTATIAAG